VDWDRPKEGYVTWGVHIGATLSCPYVAWMRPFLSNYFDRLLYGEWWRWALVSPDGVAPSRMVSVSACVNLPLHHKVQKFSSGTGSPGWSQKTGCKTVVVWWCYYLAECRCPYSAARGRCHGNHFLTSDVL